MAKRRVFLPDKLSDEALGVLAESADIEVDDRPGLPLEEKLRAAADADAVIIRSATTVDAAFLEAAPKLEMVVRAGVGVDNVDLDAASRRGVVVQNVPDGNTRSAAEHTIALILALARNVPAAQASLRSGAWERSKFIGVEVQGKTLGVIGLGKIGRHVVDMAKGLGFEILAFDPFVAPRMAEEMGIELIGDVGELAARSDFLTVHVPKSDATRGLIDARVLERARTGIRIINCARGGILDEDALLAALESGKVGGAALDVFETEPPENRALVEHPNVVATPHLGASTREAQENVAVAAARMVVDWFGSGKLHSPLNTVTLDPALREELEPYGALGCGLGRIQAQLLRGNPKRVVVKYFGKRFDRQALGYIAASVLRGFLADRSAAPVNEVNARIIAGEQGLAVEERNEGVSQYFVDLVKVEVEDSDGRREVGGAIRGRRGLRFVSFDNYQFDAVLEGTFLITANRDRPGLIGAVGTALAADAVNIAYMSLGRLKSGGTAMSVINLDGVLPEGALERVRALDGVLWAAQVTV